MMGDFNDTPGSPTLEALLDGPTGAAPKPPAGLFDLHAGLPADERITYLKVPYRDTIDYILASSALKERMVLDSARVIQDGSLLGGSDHAPVTAKFDLGEKPTGNGVEKK